jgi:hypothetical protein
MMETSTAVDNLMTFGGYISAGFVLGQIYSQNLDPFLGAFLFIITIAIGMRNHYQVNQSSGVQ